MEMRYSGSSWHVEFVQVQKVMMPGSINYYTSSLKGVEIQRSSLVTAGRRRAAPILLWISEAVVIDFEAIEIASQTSRRRTNDQCC